MPDAINLIKDSQKLEENIGTIAIITGDKVEDVEFFYPYYRLAEAGYRVETFTPDGGGFTGKNGMELSESKPIDQIGSPDDYIAIYLPGGEAPESLRENDKIIQFITNFAEAGKPIGAICHGPQLLATAGLINGKKIAAWPDIEDEMISFGAKFVDAPIVTDGQLITGRMPGDLPHQLKAFIERLESDRANSSNQERHAA